MKDASGELSMTVITIIAVVAVGAIFAFFVWPIIQRSLADTTCRTYGNEYEAVKQEGGEEIGNNVTANKFLCCKKTNHSDCKPMD